ncbi:HAD family hydrolase [Sporanaerobium hydrogeniformans]|uniref:HAD family hydrolase n=1 Tax=Sporanaerobium hydrogeniformans TaxID=3072179 RepID=A0AC61DFV7_9FIRM|nr:Cof-type HAD-IIB family hydrolase [Sporanaerobium hydrogeniformans]PHV71571.1 HAD family hydrolase [Sporanaerobium hydrogeniformans]
MIKLIATDMDGTLLNAKGELPKDFYDVFKALKERGIQFVVASGRQYATLKRQFGLFSKDMLFIAENGSLVMEGKKELACHPLDKKIARELIKLGQSLDQVHVVLCMKQGAYIERGPDAFIKEVGKYYVQHQVVPDLLAIEGDILKVTYFDFKGAEQNSWPIVAAYKDKVQIAVAGTLWVDMMAKEVNKGRALEDIQKRLHISYEETAVFGDYLNDYEMLQKAYYSYAMENAHEDVKKIARYGAKHHDENGVLDAIQTFLL